MKKEHNGDQATLPSSPEDPVQTDPAAEEPSAPIESKMPRRVKVYLLQGDDWLDNGTGYCMGQVDAESRKPYFIVRNESNSEDVILQSYLEGRIQYQRQQETLIVWTDLSGKDLALSFQENEGCEDLCDFIVRVQRESLSPLISLYYVLTAIADPGNDGPREITELITGPVTYPPEKPTAESLEEIFEVINQGSNSLYTRFKILRFFTNTKYVDKLICLFLELEDAHALEGLHLLSDIFRVLLMYNEPLIVEELVQTEDRILGLAGIMEYQRECPRIKACHREYLLDETKLKTVIDIKSPPMSHESQLDIFKREFYLNYLRNNVLAQFLEDQSLSILSTMIHNNELEILEYLKDSQANDNFMERLFGLYKPVDTTVRLKRDGVKLLFQYILTAKGHVLALKPEFFGLIVKAGLIDMIKFALQDTDRNIRVIGTEILVTVIDQDLSFVNSVSNEHQEVDEVVDVGDYNSPEGDSSTNAAHKSMKFEFVNDVSLILVLGEVLLIEKDPGLKLQVLEAIKSLLCSAIYNGEESETRPKSELSESQEASSTHGEFVRTYFLTFYGQIAPRLFENFAELVSGDKKLRAEAIEKMKEDPTLFQHLCDLISFCCKEHDPALCRPFYIERGVLAGILEVLYLDVSITLKLGVLRCFKSLILLDDPLICEHIIERNLFAPFFLFFKTVAKHDSLANSLCLDLVEIISKRCSSKNLWSMATHICSIYKEFLETEVAYAPTGKALILAVQAGPEAAVDATTTTEDMRREDITPTPATAEGHEPEKESEGQKNLFEGIGNLKRKGDSQNGESSKPKRLDCEEASRVVADATHA